MPLLDLYNKNQSHVIDMNLKQIISMAGDGNLKDNSDCSNEFRQFLRYVELEKISDYKNECLKGDGIEKIKGLVLQDIVNELGKRLDYKVESGLYHGRSNEIGYDGIWKSNNEENEDLIIEVKSGTIYQVDPSIVNKYRKELIENNKVKDSASILIVVGLGKTETLESAIRGSDFRNTTRIVTVDGLFNLVKIKQEQSDDPDTIIQIRKVFAPIEYTKIDKLIEIVYKTAEDTSKETPEYEERNTDKSGKKQIKTNAEVLNEQITKTIKAFSSMKKISLIKKVSRFFTTENEEIKVHITASKRYGDKKHKGYWFGYQKKYDEQLKDANESYYILSCLEHDFAYAIPHKIMQDNLDNLHTTINEKKKFHWWHIHLEESKTKPGMFLKLGKKKEILSLEEYKFKI